MSERTGHAAAPAAYPRLHGRSRRLFAPRPRLSGRRRRAGKGERRHAARRHGSGAPLGDDSGARPGRPLPRRAEGGRARRPPRHHRRAHAQGRNQPDRRKRPAARDPPAVPLGHGWHTCPAPAERRRSGRRLQRRGAPVPPRSGAAAAPDHPRARHARHHRRTAFRRTELRFCRLPPAGRAAAP